MSFCLKTMLQSGQARAFPLLVTTASDKTNHNFTL